MKGGGARTGVGAYHYRAAGLGRDSARTTAATQTSSQCNRAFDKQTSDVTESLKLRVKRTFLTLTTRSYKFQVLAIKLSMVLLLLVLYPFLFGFRVTRYIFFYQIIKL